MDVEKLSVISYEVTENFRIGKGYTWFIQLENKIPEICVFKIFK